MSFIDIPLPILTRWPPSLDDSIYNALQEYHHIPGRVSRDKIDAWSTKWWSVWSSSEPIANAILEWVQSMTFLTGEFPIDLEEIADIFFALIRLDFSDSQSLRKGEEELAQFQILMIKRTYKHRNLIAEMEEAYEPLSDEEDENCVDHFADPTGASNHVRSAASLEERLYKSSYSTCLRWSTSLGNIFFGAQPETLTIQKLDGRNPTFKNVVATVVLVLRDMKKVPKKLYKSREWEAAVIHSGLYKTIERISDPRYLIQYSQPHGAALMRFHKVGVTLARILDGWTAPEVVSCWDGNAQMFVPQNDGWLPLNTAFDFINALKKCPRLLQVEAYPQDCFFLLTEDNFTLAWNFWLGPYLDHENYNLSGLQVLRTFYSTLKQDLLNMADRQSRLGVSNLDAWKLETQDQEVVRQVLQRTVKLWKLQTEVKKETFDFKNHRAWANGQCKKCSHLPPKEHCVQEELVTLNDKPDFVKKYRGAGISMVPPADHMRPVPPRGKRAGRTATKIYHPDDPELRLKRIESSPAIKQRCGRQLYKIVDKDTHEMIDFVLFVAFAPVILSLMVQHGHTVSGVRELRRGSQFDFYTDGHMHPFGSRQPAGGAPGDTYTAYRGIDGSTPKGRDILFDHAEDGLVLMQTARSVHPRLFKNLQEQSAECDRLGIDGANIFRCEGYISPQHLDDDAAPGLCAQLEWDADSLYCEFGFVQLQFGYYIRTESNMLWSFDSAYLHGTMLPSKQTVLRLRGGGNAGRRSSGVHKTGRRKDANRATADARVRRTHQARSAHWEGRAQNI